MQLLENSKKQPLADSYTIEAAKLANKGKIFGLQSQSPILFSASYTGQVIATVCPERGVDAGKVFIGEYLAGDKLISLYRLDKWLSRQHKTISAAA